MRIRSLAKAAPLAFTLLCVLAPPAWAATIITNLSDTGTLVTTTYGGTATTTTYQHVVTVSSSTVSSLYDQTGISLVPVFSGAVLSAYKVTFVPGPGFTTSANSLNGSKTSILSSTLVFDMVFDHPIKPTVRIVEGGTVSTSGNGRASAAALDLAGGLIISQTDAIVAPEMHGVSFAGNAAFTTSPNGTWSMSAEVSGFSKSYQSYHVVIGNDLIAEALAMPDSPPSFATITEKELSLIFAFDASSGGGPRVSPEPATAGMMLMTGALLLARRNRRTR
jgi:hypothetical protein